MTTPTALVELIEASSVGAVDERVGFAAFDANLSDASLRERWLALRSEGQDFIVSTRIVYKDSDVDLEDDAQPQSDEPLRITLDLCVVDGELRLLFAASLARCLDALEAAEAVRLADMRGDETFATDRSRFGTWTSDPLEPFAAAPLPITPRSIVRDFTPTGATPSDIRPWVLRRAPTKEGAAFKIWRIASVRRLAAALANQVSGSEVSPVYHFTGPPTRDLSFSDAELEALFGRLNDAAAWVFRDARDSESRHLLMSNELARSWTPGAPVGFGSGALESARSAYEAYVRSGSRETLKALAELRRSVIDEAQKAAQRAQDLAGALWKDVAVAAVPFAFKAFPEGAKVANANTAGAAALFAAAFLVFSFAIQGYINAKHFERLAFSRKAWRRSLSVALSDQEIEDISERPLQDSVSDYNRVKTAVGWVYLLLVLTLLGFALHQFQTA
jgi:hypothetical protein